MPHRAADREEEGGRAWEGQACCVLSAGCRSHLGATPRAAAWPAQGLLDPEEHRLGRDTSLVGTGLGDLVSHQGPGQGEGPRHGGAPGRVRAPGSCSPLCSAGPEAREPSSTCTLNTPSLRQENQGGEVLLLSSGWGSPRGSPGSGQRAGASPPPGEVSFAAGTAPALPLPDSLRPEPPPAHPSHHRKVPLIPVFVGRIGPLAGVTPS